MPKKNKLLIIVNVDWFFLSHRLPIALAAIKNGYEVHVATVITDRRQELCEHGFIVHELKLDRSSLGFIEPIRSSCRIFRILKEVSPDIIHLVTIKPIIFGGIAAAIIRAPAVVVAFSGLGHVFSATGLLASLRRMVALILYRIVFSNRRVAVIFQNRNDINVFSNSIGLSGIDVYLIPGSGVDLNSYLVRPVPTGVTTVMLVARLIADKGVREFVEAARILSRKDLRFVLVGDIDESNPTSLSEQEVGNFVSEGVVEHWGFRSDIPETLAKAHIVVLPSYYGEGLPKVLSEAAACGRAVVTTDHPGCRDAVEQNVSGLVVRPRDAKSLATAIAYLADNPNICARMGLQGRRLAEQKYDINNIVDAHLKIYTDLLKQ